LPTKPVASYLALAFGAVVARIERDLLPGLARDARSDLKNEADTSMVWTLAGEHETAEERAEHDKAIAYLGKLAGIVEKKHGGRRGKRRKRKRA
jgi:hypothetical protein